MRVLLALDNASEEELINDLAQERSDVFVRVVRSMAETRELLTYWVPDVAFVDPATILDNGAFAGTRASDLDNPQVSVDSLAETGYLQYLIGSNSKVNFVIVADGGEYASAAMSLHASGYVVRPLEAETVRSELDNLRFPVPEPTADDLALETFDDIDEVDEVEIAAATASVDEGLFIRAFGNFEVFYNGAPVKFKHGRTKELLAYLIDRNGAMVSNGELTSILWKDGRSKSHASYLRMMKLDLGHTLEEIGCEDMVAREHGRMACVPPKIHCDYFTFLQCSEKGAADLRRITNYRGEYMSQYHWAETTNAYLAAM